MAETNLCYDLSEIPPSIQDGAVTLPRRNLIENNDLSCYPKTVPEKLKSVGELAAIAAQARAKGQTVVFTNGCFDLLHRGHVHTAAPGQSRRRFAHRRAQQRSIGEMPSRRPKRPILPETDRVELIAAMEMVDYVILFDEPDPYQLIAAIKPQVLAKGGDWSSDKIIGADIVEAAGGRVVRDTVLERIFNNRDN